MRLIKKEETYNTIDKEHKPIAIVSSGEIFQVETQLNGGDWLNSIEDRWAPEKSKGPNLCTVLGVEGAMPGDTLAIKISKSRFSKRNRGRVVRQLAAFLCTTLPCAAGFNISRSFKLATDGSKP